jgi:hypothetical protein
LLKDHYPDLNLQHVGGQMHLESYFRGLKPSFLSLLLDLVPPEQLAPSARESHVRASGMDAGAFALCRSVFDREGVVRLPEESQMRLCEWLAKGREGKPLSIVSPVCPDYAAEENAQGRYRFTFESLNDGIGLAAQRLFESLPALRDLFAEIIGATAVTHHVYVGDFEGFNDENVSRVGLDRQGFAERLVRSCDVIAARAPRPVVTALFASALCGGEAGWLREYAQMHQRIETGEFAQLKNSAKVREIARARAPLYQRWFPGHEASDKFFEELVVKQGVEYAVMGKLIKENFENPLVLGADHHKMGYFFYPLDADIPVVYLSRNYE